MARFVRDSVCCAFRYGMLGSSLSLDASTRCQLRCPACSQARGELGVVGRGHLEPGDLARLLDDNPRIRNVELSNYGEIFLNPGLGEILRHAHERGVSATALNGVNLNTVADEDLEAVVRRRVLFMVVSIDGATNETYREYRRGGDLEQVLANVRRVNALKEKHATPFPRLVWQFVVFGHNHHEVEQARKMANELGMGFLTKLNWSDSYSPIERPEDVVADVGFAPDRQRENRFEVLQLPMCAQLWYSPQINWDGKLLGCCANKTGDFGNVFSSGLGACLKSERYRYAKRMVLGKEPPRDDIPCTDCPTYHKLRSGDRRPVRDTLLRLVPWPFVK